MKLKDMREKVKLYSGVAYKHHIAEHFENGSCVTHPSGAGAGATIFLDYKKMVDYLKKDGRSWYVAELQLNKEFLIFEYDNDYMATIQKDCISKKGFKPLFIMTTLKEYDSVTAKCKAIFDKKNCDYGSAWRIMRPSSITDQLYIKAKRIRTLETTATNKVGESVESEYIGLINYGIMAMIQFHNTPNQTIDVIKQYDLLLNETKALMERKNHDYGEAWREMRVSSLTDLILMKLLRIKQIEDNDGKTIISEGIVANYQDIVNYAVFALIKLNFCD